MARPTKLTPDVQRRIVTAIKQGATYELASHYGGITYKTFNEWMKQGESDSEGLFCEFREAIKKAEGEAAVKWLRVIENAGRESWQAMAWKLERRYPRDYGYQIHKHVGNEDDPIVLKVVYGQRVNSQPETSSS